MRISRVTPRRTAPAEDTSPVKTATAASRPGYRRPRSRGRHRESPDVQRSEQRPQRRAVPARPQRDRRGQSVGPPDPDQELPPPRRRRSAPRRRAPAAVDGSAVASAVASRRSGEPVDAGQIRGEHGEQRARRQRGRAATPAATPAAGPPPGGSSRSPGPGRKVPGRPDDDDRAVTDGVDRDVQQRPVTDQQRRFVPPAEPPTLAAGEDHRGAQRVHHASASLTRRGGPLRCSRSSTWSRS